jgi:hypothetical protein
MATDRPRRPRPRRRTAAIATSAAALALSVGLLTGCEFGDTLDCVSNADKISDSLRDIHRAGWDAVEDPTKTDESIDTIEKNLDKIDDETGGDDNDVDKAVDDLSEAVKDYNQSILDGDTSPDSSRIDAAADKLKDVCTS